MTDKSMGYFYQEAAVKIITHLKNNKQTNYEELVKVISS